MKNMRAIKELQRYLQNIVRKRSGKKMIILRIKDMKGERKTIKKEGKRRKKRQLLKKKLMTLSMQ